MPNDLESVVPQGVPRVQVTVDWGTRTVTLQSPDRPVEVFLNGLHRPLEPNAGPAVVRLGAIEDVRTGRGHPDGGPASTARRAYVAAAVADADHPSTVEEALHTELACLWCRLEWAIRDSTNGVWSTACDGLTQSIVALSRVVGPCRLAALPTSLVASGLYAEIHQAAGIPVEVSPPSQVEQLAARFQRLILTEAANWDERFPAGPGRVCSVSDAAWVVARHVAGRGGDGTAVPAPDLVPHEAGPQDRDEAVSMLAHYALSCLWGESDFQPEGLGCCHVCCAPCAALYYLERMGLLDFTVRAWPEGMRGSDMFIDERVDRDWLFRQWTGSKAQQQCGHRLDPPAAGWNVTTAAGPEGSA